VTTSIQLAQYQQATVDHAREALARPHGHGTHDLAYRIGVLEFHLAEMLALVDRIAGQDG